jgi:signal transduction histidine kinase
LTDVRLADCVDIALANLRHHIEANQVEIAVADLPRVRGDRTQLALVMQNLVGNAIKYRRAAAPDIRIEAAREGDYWRVSVSDNGLGVDPEYAAQIFEPFKRLHGPEVPGSGIGLATCKRIVERLGGRIWVESTPGTGSTFNFTIPF